MGTGTAVNALREFSRSNLIASIDPSSTYSFLLSGSRERPGVAKATTTARNPPTKDEMQHSENAFETPLSQEPSTAVNQLRSSGEEKIIDDEQQSSTFRETQCREEAEMRGFKAFLIVIKGFDAVFMVGVLLLVYLVGSVAFYPFTIFCVIELVTLLVAVIHARRPSLGVLLAYISLEIGKALAAITLSLTTVLYDHDKDCSVTDCVTFDFSPVERFRFFWFLISKAAFSMFLCLVAMAHSPQLHDYNAEEDTVPLSF